MSIVPGTRSHRRSAGVERGHGRARVDPHLRQVVELGTAARDRRWAGLWRGNLGLHVPRLRRTDWKGAVAGTRPTPVSSDRHRRSPSTDVSTSRCSRGGASTRVECRTGSTRSAPASFPRCRKVARCGCSRSATDVLRVSRERVACQLAVGIQQCSPAWLPNLVACPCDEA